MKIQPVPRTPKPINPPPRKPAPPKDPKKKGNKMNSTNKSIADLTNDKMKNEKFSSPAEEGEVAAKWNAYFRRLEDKKIHRVSVSK